MNEQLKNSVGSHHTGYFVRVLLVFVLLMQVVIVWGLFRKPQNTNCTSTASDKEQSDSIVDRACPKNELKDFFDIAPRERVQHDPFVEMDAMMASAFRDMARLRSAIHIDDGWDSMSATPALDMRDTDSDYIISISIPDADPNDIDVSLDGRILSVKAFTPQDSGNYSSVRRYEQHILLPGPVCAASNLCAFITNDILRITIPKYGK